MKLSDRRNLITPSTTPPTDRHFVMAQRRNNNNNNNNNKNDTKNAGIAFPAKAPAALATAAAPVPPPSPSSAVLTSDSPQQHHCHHRHHRHHYHHHHHQHEHPHQPVPTMGSSDESPAIEPQQQQQPLPGSINAILRGIQRQPIPLGEQQQQQEAHFPGASYCLPVYPPPPPPPLFPPRRPSPFMVVQPSPSSAVPSAPPLPYIQQPFHQFMPETTNAAAAATSSFLSVDLDGAAAKEAAEEEEEADDELPLDTAMMEMDLLPPLLEVEQQQQQEQQFPPSSPQKEQRKKSVAFVGEETTTIAGIRTDKVGNDDGNDNTTTTAKASAFAAASAAAQQLPPLVPPPPKLPQPNEMPANIIPPEMEQETRNWRQYAVAALFRGASGRREFSKDDDEEDEGEEDRLEKEQQQWTDDDDAEEEAADVERQKQHEQMPMVMGKHGRKGDKKKEDAAAAEGGAEQQFRERRSTVTCRFPTDEQYQQKRNNHRGAVARKLSMGHQRYSTGDRWRSGAGLSSRATFSTEDSEEQMRQVLGNEQMRRLSLTERNSSLLDANYAILRKSIDRFEVVGSFHSCHTEAYRHFLQSLTCYDLAAQHGLIAMLDEELSIQKAVQIACAHPSPRVAVISNCRDSQRFMFTVTDCLLALHRAHTGHDSELGTRTLRYFIEKVQSGRRLISVNEQTSVWDLMRVFTLNRVHRVPVFCTDTAELTAILCPRVICIELLKLLDSKCALQPNLHIISLKDKLFGTWGGPDVIASLKEGQSCAHAVNVFLEKQVLALPVLSAKTNNLLGVLDKNDLLDRLFEHLGSFPTPQHCFLLMEETPVEDLLPLARRRTIRADISVADAMRALTEDGLTESMFVVEPVTELDGGERLCGVISHTDILTFILNCEHLAATAACGVGFSAMSFGGGGIQPATAPTSTFQLHHQMG